MCATPGACIKPGCLARRRHITCYIFGTGQTNTLALCYLFGKTYKPAHSSATQVTKINTLDQITGQVIEVSSTHIPAEGFDDSLETCEIERCSFSVQTQFIVGL